MKYGSPVSVIIPVFNVRPYLAQALDSVLAQTYGNLDILIIDDGSTDGSAGICDAYAARDGRVRVVHQPHMGLSAARNAGLARMRGEAVAFIDADDAYLPSFAETMVSAMVRERADITVCRFGVCRTTGPLLSAGQSVRPEIPPGTYDRIGALRALTDQSLNNSVWNKLYLRELWRDIRFPEGHFYEDVDTFFRVLDCCGRVCVLGEKLYLYRKRPESITTTPSPGNLRDRIRAYEHFIGFIRAHIPEIFTPEHLQKPRQVRLTCMIALYLVSSGREDDGSGASGSRLRRRIIAAKKETGLCHLPFRIKAAYRLITVCPGLLKRIYPMYLRIRQFLLRPAAGKPCMRGAGGNPPA